MEKALKQLLSHIEAGIEDTVLSSCIAHGELTIIVPREHIIRALVYLKEDGECLFQTLVDISGADYPERRNRFDVVYHLLSYVMNQRLRVKVETDEDTPVASATGVKARCADRGAR